MSAQQPKSGASNFFLGLCHCRHFPGAVFFLETFWSTFFLRKWKLPSSLNAFKETKRHKKTISSSVGFADWTAWCTYKIVRAKSLKNKLVGEDTPRSSRQECMEVGRSWPFTANCKLNLYHLTKFSLWCHSLFILPTQNKKFHAIFIQR